MGPWPKKSCNNGDSRRKEKNKNKNKIIDQRKKRKTSMPWTTHTHIVDDILRGGVLHFNETESSIKWKTGCAKIK